MNNEMIFADGMTFKEAHEKAPEVVRGAIYFQADKFIAFLNAHKNERGYVNTKMMKSNKTGGIYFILDTYKANMEKPEALKEKSNLSESDIAQIRALRGDSYKGEINVDEVANEWAGTPFN